MKAKRECNLIPRYILQRNSHALGIGMEVSVNTLDGYIRTTWIGTEEQLRAAGAVRGNSRISGGSLFGPYVRGDVVQLGTDEFSLLITDRLPIRIVDRAGGVQESETRYSCSGTRYICLHGTRQSLYEAGALPSPTAGPRGRSAKGRVHTQSSIHSPDDRWYGSIYLQLDGSLLIEQTHWTEEECRARMARKKAVPLKADPYLEERKAERVEKKLLGQQLFRARADDCFQRFMQGIGGDQSQ